MGFHNTELCCNDWQQSDQALVMEAEPTLLQRPHGPAFSGGHWSAIESSRDRLGAGAHSFFCLGQPKRADSLTCGQSTRFRLASRCNLISTVKSTTSIFQPASVPLTTMTRFAQSFIPFAPHGVSARIPFLWVVLFLWPTTGFSALEFTPPDDESHRQSPC